MNNSSPVAVFRLYASALRGAGHAMRCSVLADALTEKGWSCIFATEAESYEFIPALSRFSRIDPDYFLKNPFIHDLLVIDHYDWGYEEEQSLRPYAGKLMVIDDLCNRQHACDILLDQSYGRTVKEYQDKVSSNCLILTGPTYALIRPAFADLREQALLRRKTVEDIETILINFGGNDQKNMTLKSLMILKEIKYSKSIHIVFGFQATHRQSVLDFLKNLKNKVIVDDQGDMPKLMLSADLAIASAGSSTWERCCLGLPSVIVQTADNQFTILQNLMRDQVIIADDFSKAAGLNIIQNFDPETYQLYAHRAAAVTDGQGCKRVLKNLQINQ
jgi:UDP-2,4-diacetamido-2,4,6-trideoxy-beta-L-altropyranose hydrolase